MIRLNITDIPGVVPNKLVFPVVLLCPKGVVCWVDCWGCPNKFVPDVAPKPNPVGLFDWPNAEVAVLVPKRFVLAFCWVPNKLVLVFVVPNPIKRQKKKKLHFYYPIYKELILRIKRN